MKVKLIGIIVCMLLIGTMLPVNATFLKEMKSKAEITNKGSYILDLENNGVTGVYKSLIDIPAPDGNEYNCLMYCNNHEQVTKWISQIDQGGFDTTWLENIIKLIVFYFTPGSILVFGLDDFFVWFMDLFLLRKHQDKYLEFLDDYNDTGMITYIWFTSVTKKLVDFKIQPDNTWIENSWILDNGNYIPNPDIWYERMPFVPY